MNGLEMLEIHVAGRWLLISPDVAYFRFKRGEFVCLGEVVPG
ncbi:hypothetical protein [Bradyrhizobium brasilense]|nr:hypothetical protein [Bradyrhizobium brasilense]